MGRKESNQTNKQKQEFLKNDKVLDNLHAQYQGNFLQSFDKMWTFYFPSKDTHW